MCSKGASRLKETLMVVFGYRVGLNTLLGLTLWGASRAVWGAYRADWGAFRADWGASRAVWGASRSV